MNKFGCYENQEFIKKSLNITFKARMLVDYTNSIDILSISFLSIRPTPEIARALEAEYRENLYITPEILSAILNAKK